MTEIKDEPEDSVGLPEDAVLAEPSAAARQGWKSLLKGLVMIASLALVGLAFREFGLAEALDTAWLDNEVVGRGPTGEVMFIGLGALLVAVGLPRQVVAFGGGYAFGLLEGTVIALLAQGLGCAFTFFYARWLGRSFVRHRFGERIRRIDEFLRGNPFSMTLLIRFLPVGSNLITNLAAGVTSVGAGAFLAGSLLGYIPQTIIFALLGSGIRLDPEWRVSLSVALFVVSGALGVYLYRRVRRSRRAAKQAL